MKLSAKAWVDPDRQFDRLLATQFKGLFRSILKRCASLLGDKAAAEDVAQEALLQAWRKRRLFDRTRNLGAWVQKIGSRLCLEAQRERFRRARRNVTEECQIPADPADAFVEGEERGKLWHTLMMLCPRHREALVRHYIKEEPYQAIAQQMNVSLPATYTLVHRARRAFRDAYETEEAGSCDTVRNERTG